MLHHLRVECMGVIPTAVLDPSRGFTVITGETGAGKTLLLGGLRLLTGDRADSSVVASDSEHAKADALFEDGGAEVAVSRIVPKIGKSRAYLDGILVSATTLEDAIAPLVEIVRQHDQLSLRRPAYVLGLVDAKGDQSHQALFGRYRASWDALATARQELETLGGDQMTLRRELDLVRYQSDEISRSAVEPDEDNRLEAEVSRLRNVEEIAAHVAETLRLLERINDDGGEVVARTRKMADLDPTSRDISESAEAAVEAGHELTRSIERMVGHLDADPGRLEFIDHRLTLIGDLKRKYGRTIEEITSFGEEAARRAETIDTLLERVDVIESDLTRLEADVTDMGAQLSRSRNETAREMVGGAMAHLRDLGMDSPLLEIRFDSAPPGPTGVDRVELWFASDRRLTSAKVSHAASGGELSRLVLAMRLASQNRADTTLIFDEVDTGVGGATALALGRKIAELARRNQVLCVTHLPQVAAFADTHYVVSREGATAEVRRVEGDARVVEISRMLAGLPDSQAGLGAAGELLAIARS